MPIQIYIHEKGLYGTLWQGDVSHDDIATALTNISQLADFHDVRKFVHIMDFTNVDRIPFDVASLWRSIDDDIRVQAFIIVNPPIKTQIVLKMLQKLSIHQFHHFSSQEEALNYAADLYYS